MDSKEYHLFYIMENVNADIAIIDLNEMFNNIDLTSFANLKIILTHGRSAKFTLTTNCEILALEDCIDFQAATTKTDYTRVHNFEDTANRQQILTYSQTSGSTGWVCVIHVYH